MHEPHPIPALDSNYIWILCGDQPGNKDAWVIDPGEAQPVEDHLEAQGLNLAGILITHHHWDHTNGLPKLLKRHPVPVYGPSSVQSVTHPLAEGDCFSLLDADWEVLAVPGHTVDHLAYLARDQEQTRACRLFCGDALFAGGCGRLFEGTPEMALTSLHKLAGLPETTGVYSAHEYTVKNLQFALSVDKDNPVLQKRLAQVTRLREAARPSLPSTIALERQTNLFLRSNDPAVRASLEAWSQRSLTTEVDTFAELRRRKDRA